MKRCLICSIMLVFLISIPQAIDYSPKAGPWSLDFSSSKNFSVWIFSNVESDYSSWQVVLLEAAGTGSTSFNLLSYNEPKPVDILLDTFLSVYLKNVTSPTKGPIFIAGSEGIQGEGRSNESKETLHVAVWPYRPYSDPDSKANLAYDLIVMKSNLPSPEFREIAESLHLSKSYWFDLKPWTVEFSCSQRLIAEKELLSGNYLLNLYDQDDHLVAWIATYSFRTLEQASNQNLDKMLDNEIALYQVTSPIKKSITIDGTQGRMAEGYSANYGRKWRGTAYPIGAKYDAFTGTNSTKNFATFDSLQDTDQFQEILNSIHVSILEK
jgi:hypothetical protein